MHIFNETSQMDVNITFHDVTVNCRILTTYATVAQTILYLTIMKYGPIFV